MHISTTANKVLIAAMLAAFGGALAHSSSAGAAVLSASNGFADNSALAQCFQRSWNNPGQVRYNGCGNLGEWYDIPMPIFSTGNKSLSVYMRCAVGGILSSTCDAFVVSSNGAIVRWDEKIVQASTAGPFEGWVNFNSLAVNTNESAIIECTLPTGNEADPSRDSFLSAVKGF